MRVLDGRQAWIGVSGAAVLALGLAAGGDATDQRGDRGRSSGTARNVVLMVGDGLSTAAREATKLYTVGKDGRLEMDRFRYAGWTSTESADPEEAVTDSAAAATAFATGVRTNNGAVSVDLDNNPVPTLLEYAARMHKATGLVTTAQVTDATPAAFGSHVPDRADQTEIARQYLEESHPDVILGGGEDWWYPEGDEGAYPDDPADSPVEVSHSTIGNLVEEAQAAGYDYVTSADELAASRADRVLGLFANEEMFEQHREGEGDEYAPVVPLATMAEHALDVLSRDRQGFFLLVEEEGIDEMEHDNNAVRTLQAAQAFDEAVGRVHAFADRHPGTLVLVLGDHETGGLQVETVSDADESGDPTSTSPNVTQSAEDGPFPIAGAGDLKFTMDWTTRSHTGAPTPLTAEGPGAERLAAPLKNSDVFGIVLDAMRGHR